MEQTDSEIQFAICIKNDDYQASLEIRKIYRIIPDDQADKHQLIRIIDESGEDYLYSQDYFIPVCLPTEIVKALVKIE
jgi:hypothetical protein